MWILHGTTLLDEYSGSEYAVAKSIDVHGVQIIILKLPTLKNFPENVFGISNKGDVMWQIQPLPSEMRNVDDWYVGLDVLPDGVRVYTYTGFVSNLDIRTGQISNSAWCK